MPFPGVFTMGDTFWTPQLSRCWSKVFTAGHEPHGAGPGLALPAAGAPGTFSEVDTADRFSMVFSVAQIEIVPPTGGTLTLRVDHVTGPLTTFANFQVLAGTLLLAATDAVPVVLSAPYAGETGLRIVWGGATLSWQSRLPGGGWTVRGTAATPAGFDEVRVRLSAQDANLRVLVYNDGGFPTCPTSPVVQVPHRETYVYRDAKGFQRSTDAWIDPLLPENAGGEAVIAGRFETLMLLADNLTLLGLPDASGPYWRRSVVFSGVPGPDPRYAMVRDTLRFGALAASGELVTFTLPAPLPIVLDANGQYGRSADLDVQAFRDYWLAHCCSPAGSPLVTFLVGERRMHRPRRDFTHVTRDPSLTRPGL